MTEKEIKALMLKHKINAEYNIDKERKKDKLKELKELGYDVE